MIRVNHLQLLPLLTGVQRVSLNEIQQLSNSNIEFSITVSSLGPLTDECNKINIKYYTIKNLVREISVIKDIKAFITLYRHFKKENFDVVHTHSSKTGFLGRIAAKLAKTNTVVHTVHGFAFPSANNKLSKMIYYTMEYIAGRFSDYIIVLNQKDYDISVNNLKIDKSKVIIVPNSVDSYKFKPINKVKDNKRIIKIVMVGRLWKQKNPLCLVKAIKILINKGYKVNLDYIGDGELSREIEDYIITNNLSNEVKILGWKNDIYNYLPNYDLFILPSLWEGMPLAILEAMSCGLPSVVSDIPGNNDLIKNNINGFVFKSDDKFDLAEKIIKYIDEPLLMEQHSRKARNMILDMYSSEKRNSTIINIYKNRS